MNPKELTAAVDRLMERANARQLSLILRIVRAIVGEGART